jgi:2',3'-cyclic-nucleotide 2'-phosphodiesterase (5'-nucleotidase family)
MFSIFACLLFASMAGPADKSVRLLVWSDLDGNSSPHLFAWVDSLRREADSAKQPMLALDAGDAFFGSDLSFLTRGGAEVRVLDLVKPDAMILGTGDFAWTRERLDTLLGNLTVPVLTTNLRDDLADTPYGKKDFSMWDFSGFKVGVIGVLDSDLASSDRPSQIENLRSEDPANRVETALQELRGKGADLVVALSDAGPDADEQLAGAVPGLDLVVGSGYAAEDTVYQVGRTWIARLASDSDRVRGVDLEMTDGGVSVKVSAAAPRTSVHLPSAWKPVFDSLDAILKTARDSVVGTLHDAWPETRREGYLGNFLADAIRDGSESDIGLWPASGIHAGLKKGKVTEGDLWKVTGPFSQVSQFTLPGSDLRRLILHQFQHASGFLFLSGATCTVDSSAFGGPESRISVGGKPLQGGDYYTIAIPQSLRDDLFAQTGFSLASASPRYLERWDRDLVLAYALKAGLVTTTGRVPAMYGSSR